MIRTIKTLGLMAIAALAMSAMFASAAQAQNGVLTAGNTDTGHASGSVLGTQNPEAVNKFTTGPKGENEVSCEVGTFPASVTGTDTSITVPEPSYKDCRANGLPATITMNGCEYNFDQPENIGEGEYTGTVDLNCPGENKVIIEVYLFGGVTSHSFKVCTETVEPFEDLGHVVYTNEVTEGEDDDVTMHATVSNIPYIEDNQSCSSGEQSIPNTATDAVYESEVTVKAVSPLTEVWFSDEEE